VGPPPIPFAALNVPALADAMAALQSPKYREGARRLSVQICAEDGLEAGIADFNRHLPLPDMVCDVATLLGERGGLARHYYPKLKLKVSDEVHAALVASNVVDQEMLDGVKPQRYKAWHMGAAVSSTCGGVWTGLTSFVWELLNAVLGLLRVPCTGFCHYGFAGLLLGLCSGFLLFMLRLVYAPIILLDRLTTGCFNDCCADSRAEDASGKHPRWNHCCDPETTLTTLAQCPKGPRASGMERCCGTLRCLRDAGHVDMLSRVPLKAPSAPSAERQAAIEGAFAQLLTLRRAYDSLNLSDESSSHAPQPVQSTSPLEISAPGLPLGWLSPERLPSVAEHIRAYMRQRGLKHAKFAEFVMLCRDFAQR